MKSDAYGQVILSVDDLCDLYMNDHDRCIRGALVDNLPKFDANLELANIPHLVQYTPSNATMPQFDAEQQSNWFMPKEYIDLDIAAIVLDRCTTQEQLQRAGQELIEYQRREMFPLLRYLKYIVDVMTKHNIVWGVGRGSSVASYVLYLLGVHQVDSMYYDLQLSEFLK